MFKKIGLVLVVMLVALAIWQRELVSYGWMQARGQLRILWNTQPVDEVLADATYPDSLKKKIELIREIKRFSVDSLGLEPSGSYESFYNQQGKPILWVITACEPYELIARKWHFPIIGTFSYKGFFEKDRADTLVAELKKEGLDTRIGEVSAWSTLGFLNDPILSSFLDRSEGNLAELIIHELTHGTLFIKNSLEYNENLADFVGEYGALRFLAQKYGTNTCSVSQTIWPQKRFMNDTTNISCTEPEHWIVCIDRLNPKRPGVVKDSLKWQTIRQIVDSCGYTNRSADDRKPYVQ